MVARERFHALGGSSGGAATVPTIAKMGGIIPAGLVPDVVAIATGSYSLLPIFIPAPVKVSGVNLWVGATANTDALPVQVRLYSVDGQTILADSGQVAPVTVTSMVATFLFTAQYTIATPGTYWIGVGIQGNGTYSRCSQGNGRVTGARAGNWPLPATVNPATNPGPGVQTVMYCALV